MTTQLTPQQAAMERLENLLNRTAKLYYGIRTLVDCTLCDAVDFPKRSSPGPDSDLERPFILTDEGLIVLTQLRDELRELVIYYTNQKEQFSASMAAITDRVSAIQETQIQEIPEKETVETLRERIERIAAENVNSVDDVLEKGPHVHKTIRQDRNEVLAAASKLAMGLDPAQRIAKPNTLPAALPAIDLNKDDAAPLRPLENSIMRLLGPNSPLLDIFMMSPWLANGKGFVTVGTPGFNWYKGTDPMEREPAARASLPSGFYFGEDVPKYVILRMSKCIIIWGFELEPESMSVYIAGTSDANPDSVRWFKPSDLAASHTRQLIGELLEAVEKHKPVAK